MPSAGWSMPVGRRPRPPPPACCAGTIASRRRWSTPRSPCRSDSRRTRQPRQAMTTQIIVPSLGESVTEATIAKWFKAVGDAVAIDEPVLELETDKVSLEVNAAAAGHLAEIRAEPGATVEVGAVLGIIANGAGAN